MRAMVLVRIVLNDRDPPTERLPAPVPLTLTATATATVGTTDSMLVVFVARTVTSPLTASELLSTLAVTPLGLAASPMVLVAALMPMAAPTARPLPAPATAVAREITSALIDEVSLAVTETLAAVAALF